MSKIRAQNQKQSYLVLLPKNFRIGNWKSLSVSFCWTKTDSKNPETENVSWLTVSLLLGLRRARSGRCWDAHSAADAYAAHFLNVNKSVISIITKKSAYNSDPITKKGSDKTFKKIMVNLNPENAGKLPRIRIWRENIGHQKTRKNWLSDYPDLPVSSDCFISSKDKSAVRDNAQRKTVDTLSLVSFSQDFQSK